MDSGEDRGRVFVDINTGEDPSGLLDSGQSFVDQLKIKKKEEKKMSIKLTNRSKKEEIKGVREKGERNSLGEREGENNEPPWTNG